MTELALTWEDRIARARRLLEEHLDEELPLDRLARAASYSVFHFHRLFRAATGETVRQYTRRLRLERSAFRLTHSPDEILLIALDAGYSSHEAYTRAFQANFGASPSTFREERREVHQQRIVQESALAVRIEHREPTRVAFVRHVGPYRDTGNAWQTLMKWGWKRMMFRPPELFGLGYDDPDVTPEEQCRYDACMAVPAKTKVKPPVELKDHPAGSYAVALHVGAFDRIGETYSRLFARIASAPIEGRVWALGDPPSLEKYLNDPRKTKPEDLRTEIWMPVS
ncbi:MAG: AraC family transcriptional regulator [Planctomycetota bacterium]|jgi:AraC family transcriptional regulator